MPRRFFEILKTELLFAYLTPAELDGLISLAYSGESTFVPDGTIFNGGLFAWEQAAIASRFFPQSGHVLVGGAGGGRETIELCRRGYQVTAFDPVPIFVDAAGPVVTAEGGTVLRASYRDLIDAVDGRATPFGSLLSHARFDAVVLGWCSLSHVLEESERILLLRTIRRMAPAAPVLASYYEAQMESPNSRSASLRRSVHRLLRFFGGRKNPSNRLILLPSGSPAYVFAPGEVVDLARRAGYGIPYTGRDSSFHSILLPTEAAPEREASISESRG
jgi:hypothetical protein